MIWSVGLVLVVFLACSPSCSANAPYYKFKVGDFEAAVLSDGTHPWNVSVLFPSLPLETVEEALTENFLPTDLLTQYYNVLFVNTGEKKVLFECGNGDKFGLNTGKLLESMQGAGIDPNEIDGVIVSHAHVDHASGIQKPDGTLAFPNAKYYISRVEYEFWKDATFDDFAPDRSDEVKELLIGAAQAFLEAAGDNLILFERGNEVIPGVKSIEASGHTVGHSAFIITSANESLIQAGDAFIWDFFSVERPTWRIFQDADHISAIATRFSLLEEIASSRVQLLSYHNSFPGLGHISKDSRGFTFKQSPYLFQFN